MQFDVEDACNIPDCIPREIISIQETSIDEKDLINVMGRNVKMRSRH